MENIQKHSAHMLTDVGLWGPPTPTLPGERDITEQAHIPVGPPTLGLPSLPNPCSLLLLSSSFFFLKKKNFFFFLCGLL